MTITPIDDKAPVLKLEQVAVAYKVRGGEIEAVQDVSFEIHRGEAHGIVGESGCGKSTVAWAILNFLGANGYVKRGSIKFMGQELVGKRGLVWRIACAERPDAKIGESGMTIGAYPKWREFSFVFTVPATDCPTQVVRLQLDARMPSEQLVTGAVWYDDLRIVPRSQD